MRMRFSIALFTALSAILALPMVAGAAPIDTPSEDRNEVMLATFVVAVLVLVIASVGFLFRRMKGMVQPPEDTTHSGGHS